MVAIYALACKGAVSPYYHRYAEQPIRAALLRLVLIQALGRIRCHHHATVYVNFAELFRRLFTHCWQLGWTTRFIPRRLSYQEVQPRQLATDPSP